MGYTNLLVGVSYGLCMQSRYYYLRGVIMPLTKEKQFRSCRATTFSSTSNGSIWLRSYSSLVCRINKKDKTIIFFPAFHYGSITDMHVRKFLKDTIGFAISIPTISEHGFEDFTYKGYEVKFRVIAQATALLTEDSK